METRETEVYEYDELDMSAQERALNDHLRGFEYPWGDDVLDSLRAFADHFGASITDYNLDPSDGNRWDVRFSLDANDDEYTEEYIAEQIESAGTYNPDTFKGNGDCKLTGVCFDEDALDGLRIAFMNGENDIYELLKEGMWSLASATERDYNYLTSEENFVEEVEASRARFYENGEQVY